MNIEQNQTVQRLRSAGLLDENNRLNLQAYSQLPFRQPAEHPNVGKVFGKDTRVEVATPDQPPYHAILYLILQFGSELYRGTGFLVQNNMVLTAGHNLFDKVEGDATGITAFAQYKDNAGEMAVAGSWKVTDQFKNKDCDENDYGVVNLTSPLGSSAGLMKIRDFAATDVHKKAFVTGFPMEVGGVSGQSKMFTASGPLDGFLPADHTVTYVISTSGGNSGSPVYVSDGNGGYEAVAIHVSGARSYNCARVIDADVRALIGG